MLNSDNLYIYIHKETPWRNIFELVELTTASDGGDGAGLIITENYKELADAYDLWRKTPRKVRNRLGYDWTREGRAEQISFHDGSNESITFTDESIHRWRDWYEYTFIIK